MASARTDGEPPAPLVVGYAFMSKKADTFRATLSSAALEWRAIDLEALGAGQPLADQGPFDVVIHKLSEDIHAATTAFDGGTSRINSSCVGDGDGGSDSGGGDGGLGTATAAATAAVASAVAAAAAARRRVAALEAFARDYPGVPLVDSPSAVARVVDRARTGQLLRQLHGRPLGNGGGGNGGARERAAGGEDGAPCPPPPAPWRLVAPRFVVAPGGVTAATAGWVEGALAGVGVGPAPLIVKPVLACGPGASHMLSLLLDRPSAILLGSNTSGGSGSNGVSNGGGGGNDDDKAAPRWLGQPSVVQEYVNHGGRLLKVYVLGDEVRLVVRPSLPDLPRSLWGSSSSSSTGGGVGCVGDDGCGDCDGFGGCDGCGGCEDAAGGTGCGRVVLFDSQKPYPTLGDILASSPAAAAAPGAAAPGAAAPGAGAAVSARLERAVGEAAALLRGVFGLSLFGFDCVVPVAGGVGGGGGGDEDGGDLMVLDVNYFPSYKELQAELPALLHAHFTGLLRARGPQPAPEGINR